MLHAPHRIHTRLRSLSDGRATVFTTHRLTNQGHVGQMGTYDELAHQGLFHEPLKHQEDQ